MSDSGDRTRDPEPTARFARRLAAVLAADIAGYTRLMELYETDTHMRLMNLRFGSIEPSIARHRGQIVKNTGDGFLAMFDSARDAINCAVEVQRFVSKFEVGEPIDKRIAFRMAINLADVIVEDHDIYGDGVNIAARLQTYAEPGGIVVSGSVADAVASELLRDAVDLGPMELRNLQHPVRMLSIKLSEDPATDTSQSGEVRPSIAVLPFRKVMPSPDEGYFADGIVENIIQALGRLKELLVISYGSTLSYGGPTVDVRAVGRELGVRYVLHGSAQRIASRLRISTELSDAETGEVIRSDNYDGVLDQLFEMQDRIAVEVAKTIAPNVRERELARAKRKHPQNMTAYDLLLQALEAINQLDYATYSRARGLLQQAMTSDPSYARPFAFGAWWHGYRMAQGWSPDPAADAREALRLANMAIVRDGEDALALAIYGHQRSYFGRDFVEAMHCFDSAISACPSCDIAWTMKGATLGYMDDGANAIVCAENGVRLSPRGAHLFFAEHILAQAFYVASRFEEAIVWGRRSMSRNERLTSNLRTLAASFIATDQIEEAQAIARAHSTIAKQFSLAEWSAKTPFRGKILETFVARLLRAGM